MSRAWAIVENGVVLEERDADHLVPWWSFTKTVLAAAALRLVQDGAMKLEEPLAGRPYTLRHLLQHRSGLPEYGSLSAYHEAVARGDDPWSVAELLDRTEADRLRYQPGVGWDYSNIGYLVVRQMIEEVTHEGIDAALRRLVLDPLQIETARMATRPEDLRGVSMGDAASYHPAWVYHGLLVGSIKDAALLLQRLMGGLLLSIETLATASEPFVLPGPIPGRPWKVPGYGLGLMIGQTTNDLKVAGHTGGGPGSMVAVYSRVEPAGLKRTAAVFGTGDDQDRIEGDAFDLLDG